MSLKVSSEVNLLFEEIVNYSKTNSSLWKCHHFLFDKPVFSQEVVTPIDYLVMGINPGETESCRVTYPKQPNSKPLEDSSRTNLNHLVNEFSAIRWRNKCKDILGIESNVVLSELFFWSTPNVKILKEIFTDEELKIHFDFCKSINIRYITYRNPRIIVFTGITMEKLVSELYDLKQSEVFPVPDSSGQGRLMTFWNYNGKPWIFTKHWSAGISRRNKHKIASHLHNLFNCKRY
jgi:hypothetical protein